jgi:adenine-specific DNA-methyltransferase
MFNLKNRRYTGSKYKLKEWIKSKVLENCPDSLSFCDLFAGTGVIAEYFLDNYKEIIINDYLISNFIIYSAFFSKSNYSDSKVQKFSKFYQSLDIKNIKANYVSKNYGNKFFNIDDALIIGFIREHLETNKTKLNNKEYAILLASLIYSFDKVALTVGHYDAYFKGKASKPSFKFTLIKQIKVENKISIYSEDANQLVRKIKPDVVYIDPPYSSRQYNRFYHVIENIVDWKKPKLFGVAMKPKPNNNSEYSKSKAVMYFQDLIENLRCKYIVVSYNNTYNSKSKSSENKMKLEQILAILRTKGKTSIFTKSHRPFNSGKTDFADHKEILFITKVN